MTRTFLLASIALLAAACTAAPPGPEVDARAALGIAGDPAREVQDAYDASRDAMADVDAALARASANGHKVVVVMGGNWCPDSRGLAWRLEQPGVAEMIAGGYELVYVDVGFMNRNLDVAQRFGLAGVRGTPTVLVLSPEGTLLNADSVETWRTASQRSVDEVRDYFAQWAG